MTFSIEHAQRIVKSLAKSPIPNFIAQAKSKQLLQEVHELPDNFPPFTKGLDERLTFIAYRMLGAGCSFIEQDLQEDGYPQLHSAGDLLESVYRATAVTDCASGFHCLIGAMAFYEIGRAHV